MNAQLRSGHPKHWRAAQELKEFTVPQLIARTSGAQETSVRSHIRRWLALGLIEQASEGVRGEPATFRLTGKTPPILEADASDQSPERNMWRAMRGLASFTPSDVSCHASTEECEVSSHLAETYCRALYGAGFLRMLRGGKRGLREPIYRLLPISGPLPPVIQRVRAVWDPNEKRHIVLTPPPA
ncbi:hypothetical protein [Pseudaestuariivita sp.]|uniref:hypothetical protein n=1 Tax=Pseudaestuariivita sp. TaxID=2211669 RepID=UPI00405A01D5